MWPKRAAELLWANSQIHSTNAQAILHLEPVSHKNVLMNSHFTPHANMHFRDGSKGLCIPAMCACLRVHAPIISKLWARSLERNWNVCFSPFSFSVSSKAVSSQPGSHDSYSLQLPTGGRKKKKKRLEQLINKCATEMRGQHLKCIRYGENHGSKVSKYPEPDDISILLGLLHKRLF